MTEYARRLVIALALLLLASSLAFALSGDGGNLKVENGKVYVSGGSATDCNDATAISPAAGECIAWCIHSSTSLTASVKVSCSVEKTA